MCQLGKAKDAYIPGITLQDVSARMFLKDIHIWVGRLNKKGLTLLVWAGIMKPMKGSYGKKGRGDRLILPAWAGTSFLPYVGTGFTSFSVWILVLNTESIFEQGQTQSLGPPVTLRLLNSNCLKPPASLGFQLPDSRWQDCFATMTLEPISKPVSFSVSMFVPTSMLLSIYVCIIVPTGSICLNYLISYKYYIIQMSYIIQM